MNLAIGETNINLILVAGGVVLFLFIVLLARLSRNFISWNFSGFGVGAAAGFIAAIIILIVLLSTSHGVIRTVLNWKDAPGAVGNAITASRSNLEKVLGEQTEEKNSDTFKSDFDNLNDEEKSSVKDYICTP